MSGRKSAQAGAFVDGSGWGAEEDVRVAGTVGEVEGVQPVVPSTVVLLGEGVVDLPTHPLTFGQSYRWWTARAEGSAERVGDELDAEQAIYS